MLKGIPGGVAFWQTIKKMFNNRPPEQDSLLNLALNNTHHLGHTVTACKMLSFTFEVTIVLFTQGTSGYVQLCLVYAYTHRESVCMMVLWHGHFQRIVILTLEKENSTFVGP